MGRNQVDDYLPPELKQAVYSFSSAVGLAWLGRMLYHVRQVQRNRRKFWSIHMVWEILTALCLGFVADGIAAYFDITGRPATAAIIVISYLGPSWIEAVLLRVLDSAFGDSKKD